MIMMIVRVPGVIYKISQKMHKPCVVRMVMWWFPGVTSHGQIVTSIFVGTSKQMESLVPTMRFVPVEFVWMVNVHQAR